MAPHISYMSHMSCVSFEPKTVRDGFPGISCMLHVSKIGYFPKALQHAQLPPRKTERWSMQLSHLHASQATLKQKFRLQAVRPTTACRRRVSSNRHLGPHGAMAGRDTPYQRGRRSCRETGHPSYLLASCCPACRRSLCRCSVVTQRRAPNGRGAKRAQGLTLRHASGRWSVLCAKKRGSVCHPATTTLASTTEWWCAIGPTKIPYP